MKAGPAVLTTVYRAGAATVNRVEVVAPDASLSAIKTAMESLGVVFPEGSLPADYAGLITAQLQLIP